MATLDDFIKSASKSLLSTEGIENFDPTTLKGHAISGRLYPTKNAGANVENMIGGLAILEFAEEFGWIGSVVSGVRSIKDRWIFLEESGLSGKIETGDTLACWYTITGIRNEKIGNYGIFDAEILEYSNAKHVYLKQYIEFLKTGFNNAFKAARKEQSIESYKKVIDIGEKILNARRTDVDYRGVASVYLSLAEKAILPHLEKAKDSILELWGLACNSLEKAAQYYTKSIELYNQPLESGHKRTYQDYLNLSSSLELSLFLSDKDTRLLDDFCSAIASFQKSICSAMERNDDIKIPILGRYYHNMKRMSEFLKGIDGGYIAEKRQYLQNAYNAFKDTIANYKKIKIKIGELNFIQ